MSIDALTGGLVAELPRTPAMADANDTGIDEFGASQTFAIEVAGSKKTMRNAALNIETFDFRFRDPEVLGKSLPGTLIAAPWSKAAVSAHVNATVVATFLREVLKRNNVDNKGGKLISTVNCVVKRDERPAGSKNWLNAFWDGKQMVYGQVTYNGTLRSLASSLDVVAHELFHGVTAATARLVYQGEPGALNESYSDIFGIFVSNLAEPDIGKWNWLIGDGISNSLEALARHARPDAVRPAQADEELQKVGEHASRRLRRRAHQQRHPQFRGVQRDDRDGTARNSCSSRPSSPRCSTSR